MGFGIVAGGGRYGRSRVMSITSFANSAGNIEEVVVHWGTVYSGVLFESNKLLGIICYIQSGSCECYVFKSEYYV